MKIDRFVAAALAAAAVCFVATSASADRPDRPPVSLIAVDGTGGQGIVINNSLDGGTQLLAGVVCDNDIAGGGNVSVTIVMRDLDSTGNKSNKLSLKQGAYAETQAHFFDGVNSTSSAIVKVDSCKASAKVSDAGKNLSYFDADDSGSFAASCGENLVAALSLDAPQTAMLNEAFPKGVSCKGKGATYFGCFRGDTMVETEAGRRPIRDVRVGDRVWSWDDAQNKRILSRVTQTYTYPARQLRTLVAGGETFRVTDRHPFWVDGRGWVEAAKLVAGDKLRTGGDALVSVRSNERADSIAFYQGYDASMDRSAALRHPIYQLQRVSTGTAPSESGIVYNIEVDGVHNYYVGDKGILVHNK
jgi:hypothetical protein